MSVSTEQHIITRGDHKLIVHRAGECVDLYLFHRALDGWEFVFRHEFRSAETSLDIIIDMLTQETMFFASFAPQ